MLIIDKKTGHVENLSFDQVIAVDIGAYCCLLCQGTIMRELFLFDIIIAVYTVSIETDMYANDYHVNCEVQ